MAISNSMGNAVSALRANQLRMDTASNNVANANNEAYSRQRLEAGFRQDNVKGDVRLGNGVDVGNVKRMVSDYLIKAEVDQAGRLGGTKVRADLTGRLDSMFSEPEGSGIQGGMEKFFQSWDDLSNNASGEAERTQVLERGRQLATLLSQRDQRLNEFQLEADKRVDDTLDEINARLERLADLNKRIVEAEAASSGETLSMRDQRDKLMRELSERIGISYYEDDKGAYNVSLKTSGHSLVQGGEYYTFKRDGAVDSGFTNFGGIKLSEHTDVDLTRQLSEANGRLGNLLALRDKTAVELRDRLDDMARGLAAEVNRVHSQGAGLKFQSGFTGSARASEPGAAIASSESGLVFGDRFQGGTIEFAVRNRETGQVEMRSATLNGDESLSQAADALNGSLGPEASVAVGEDSRLRVQAQSGHELAVRKDDSGLLAASGVNTFFSLESSAEVAAGKASAAGELQIDRYVAANPKHVAAGRLVAQTGSQGQPVTDSDGDRVYDLGVSDNRNALDLAALQTEKLSINGRPPTTFNEHYAGTVAMVGQEKATADSLQRHQSQVMEQIHNQRQQHSGVNIDEEMTKLLQFQRAYQASAKVIQTSDQMIASLLDVV